MNEPPAAITVLEATELSRRKPAWRVELTPDRIEGRRGDGASFELHRSRLADHLQLVDHGLARRVLTIRKPRRTTLQFDPDAYRALRGWLGRPLLLSIALRQRLAWTLPIGILFLIASLPLPADPASGVAAVPFDVLNAALGASLILQGLLSRPWPHRAFFLLDSLWFLVLAVDTLRGIASDGASPLWLLVVAIQLLLIRTGIRNWLRFGADAAPAPGSPPDRVEGR